MEDAQQKYMEYQMLNERIKQLQNQMQTVDQQMADVMATLESVNAFEKVKDDSEILVPVNNGIFSRAKLIKEDSVLVNVGAGVVLEKTFSQTEDLIKKQKAQLENIREQIGKNLEESVEQVGAIEKKLKNV